MYKQNLHTHCSFCDGSDTARDMVQAALEHGFSSFGFSSHSYTPFDLGYSLVPQTQGQYISTVNALKREYQGSIDILLGIEQDFYSPEAPGGLDFIIGSVHYVEKCGEYIPLDISPQEIKQGADRYYEGDVYSLLEDYFKTLSSVVDRTGCDIIGHFDLPAKFCERNPELFDTQNERYIAAAHAAAKRLIKTGKFFEINTGAMANSMRSEPYPSYELIDFIHSHGGKFVLCSDCHSAGAVDFAFDEVSRQLKKLTIDEVYVLKSSGFVAQKL